MPTKQIKLYTVNLCEKQMIRFRKMIYYHFLEWKQSCSYLLCYADVKQNVLVAVPIIDLQQKSILVSIWTVMYVLKLLAIQLLQLEMGHGHIAVHMRQVAVLRRIQNRDENVLWVIEVIDVKNGPADDSDLARLDVQDLVGHHSGWLWRMKLY